MAAQPRRAVVRDLLTAECAAELLHIARCCSAAGFRDNCCVVNASVIARVHPPFLIPLASRSIFIPPPPPPPPLIPPLSTQARARDRVRDAVEQHLGLDLSLFIEFTGLISWRPGAAISWHTDNNRDYLTQRVAAAVVYLNTAGLDFEGGTFLFRGKSGGGEEEEESVMAAPGTAVIYSTSEDHCVAPAVAAGERFTLAMWFAREPEYDEDRGILAALGGGGSEGSAMALPGLPAALHALGDGMDMRLCRLACHRIALMRQEGESGSWWVLKGLEDGGWEAPGALRVAGLADREGACNVGEPIRASVRQAVWGAQRALLRGGDDSAGGGGCTRECVCSRHVSAHTDDNDSCEPFGRCVSSCQWLEGARPHAGAGEASGALELRQRVEAAIHEYIDRIEPREVEEWAKIRSEWLRTGAVWGPP